MRETISLSSLFSSHSSKVKRRRYPAAIEWHCKSCLPIASRDRGNIKEQSEPRLPGHTQAPVGSCSSHSQIKTNSLLYIEQATIRDHPATLASQDNELHGLPDGPLLEGYGCVMLRWSEALTNGRHALRGRSEISGSAAYEQAGKGYGATLHTHRERALRPRSKTSDKPVAAGQACTRPRVSITLH